MQRVPLYGKLMELPMFQGMSKDDLAAVLGQTRFDFAQKKAGATIVRADEECTHLYFLLNGRMEVSAQAHDNGYIFTEDRRTLHSPARKPLRYFPPLHQNIRCQSYM